MGMHVPQPWQNRLSPRIDFRGPFRDLHLRARARRSDPPLLDHHRRIRDRRLARPIDQRPAHKCQLLCPAPRNPFRQFRQRRHSIRARASHEISQRALISLAYRLE